MRLLLVGTIYVAQGHPSAQSTATSARVCDGMWGVPSPLLTSAGHVVFTADPVFAAHGDSLYVVGYPTLITDPSSGQVVRRDVIGVLRASGVAIPLALPTPSMRPWAPVALTDSIGALHVVWAEADDTMPRSPVYTRLRYARLWRGRWSTPETILASPSILWDGALLKSLHLVDGKPAVATEVRDAAGTDAVLARRVEFDKWSIVKIPTVGLPLYSGLLIRSRSDLVFSYVASAWRIIGDRMSLWIAHSADSGGTWTRPSRVFTGGEATARDHNVGTLATGELQAAWVLSPTSGSPDSLVVASSADSGHTWRRVTSVPAGKPFRTQLFVGPTGVVDGFTFVPSSTRWETRHLRWAGGLWRDCSVPQVHNLVFSRASSDGHRYWLALASKQSTEGGPFILATRLSSFSATR